MQRLDYGTQPVIFVDDGSQKLFLKKAYDCVKAYIRSLGPISMPISLMVSRCLFPLHLSCCTLSCSHISSSQLQIQT